MPQYVSRSDHKGAGLAKTIATGVATAGLGAAAGALAFKEYLMRNPSEVAKLGVEIGKRSLFGGSLPKGGELRIGGSFNKLPTNVKQYVMTHQEQASKILKQKINSVAGKPRRGGQLRVGGKIKRQAKAKAKANAKGKRKNKKHKVMKTIPEEEIPTEMTGGKLTSLVNNLASGADMAKQIIENAQVKINEVKPLVKPIVRGIVQGVPEIDVSKIQSQILPHIVSNMTPHEFSVVQGLASKFQNVPHYLDNLIDKHVGGSFHMPDPQLSIPMQDILNSRSPHDLANMIHDENMHVKHDPTIGAGLYDSMKLIFSKGLTNGRKAAKVGSDIATTINNIIQKGLIIAQALEPLIDVIDPTLGDVYKVHLNSAKKFGESAEKFTHGLHAVNSALHGDVVSTLDNLALSGKIDKEKAKNISEQYEKFTNQANALTEIQKAEDVLGQAIVNKEQGIQGVIQQP